MQENEQNLIQSFKPFNAESPAGGLVSTGNSTGAQPAGNGFIDVITSGFNGAVGYFQEQATIATQQIDIFRDNLNSAFSSNVKLVADVANDTLDFITGGDLPGQILKLVGDDTIDVTINNADGVSNTSNILFPGTTNDFTLKTREIIEFIFDPTLLLNGNQGCWCYSLGDSIPSGGGGPFLPTAGGTMLGPIAYDPDVIGVDSNGRVPITSSYMQSIGIGSPDDVFYFDGALFNGQQLQYQVTNQTIQVIKNAVFLSISNIVGNGVDSVITVTVPSTSLLATGEQANITDTTNFNKNDVTITITGGTTFTYNLGSIGSATPETSGNVQRGNIVMPDDLDLTLDSTISAQGVAIANFVFDPTIPGGGGWRLDSSTFSGGGGIAFPIRYTVTTGLPTSGTVTLDLNQTSGHYFDIGPITGNIDISITNPPTANIAQAFRINITQDGTGGHTVIFNDTLLVVPLINTDVNGITLLAGDIYDGTRFNIFTMTSTAGSGNTNLLPLNNIWTGSNTFNGSPFIVNGFITTLASTTSTSITSPLIVLGDTITDSINVGGRFGTALIPIADDTHDLGTNLILWRNIFVTSVIANTINASVSFSSTGTTTLGDAITDTISFGGRVNTSIIPILDADDDLGTNLLRWDNIYGVSVIANTINASVSFSSTGTTTLGDAVTDNINFGGQVSTNIVMEEITVPANAPANTGRFYAKVDGGVSVPFWKDEAGTETSMIAGGGSGANTALSNLASVAINTSLLPNADGTLNLGSAANSWLDTFTERLRIETGGASTSTANQIIANDGGMIFNVPAGDRYEFNISGSPNGITIEEDKIQFLTPGRQHRIDAAANSITIVSESTNDSIFLFPGAARSNAAVNVQNLQTKFLNNTLASRYELLLVYTNAITTGQPAIGNIGFMADSSLNVESAYAGIVTAIDSDVSSARDGRMQLVVANNDGAGAAGVGQITGIGMDIQSSGGTMQLGFFGVSPVARQSPAANSAAIITALQNLGLFV